MYGENRIKLSMGYSFPVPTTETQLTCVFFPRVHSFALSKTIDKLEDVKSTAFMAGKLKETNILKYELIVQS